MRFFPLYWLRSGYIVVLSPHYEPLTFAWLNQHSAHWAIALACLMVLSHLLFLCVQLHKLILESVYRRWAQCVMATQHEPSSRCSWAGGTRVAPIINGRAVKLECKHKKLKLTHGEKIRKENVIIVSAQLQAFVVLLFRLYGRLCTAIITTDYWEMTEYCSILGF